MRLNRLSNNELLKESVINSKSFLGIKVKTPCKKKIFDEYVNDSFIFVLNKNGKVVVYEKGGKNTFNNLREYVTLFGSKFFKNPISNTDLGKQLKDYYEKNTGCDI